MAKTFQGSTRILKAHEGNFGIHDAHKEARCLCGEPLRYPRTMAKVINGVPVRDRGQWFGRCSRDCGYGGFYDLYE